jgi:folate-dependent phosphoribosylglycinamide formyltransferase PurN
MRIVMLCSSVYSETACAMTVRVAAMGYVPVGAVSLRTLSRGTLWRKLGQWGIRECARYARNKLSVRQRAETQRRQNPYLQPWLEHEHRVFRSLKTVAQHYGFAIEFCDDQNSPRSIACLRGWSPDLIVFTGGNILRKEILRVPRLGVLNVHLGWLPQVRGMSSPEWSLLTGVPVGITIHYMDSGVDTGPILVRHQYREAAQCQTLQELRHRLIAFGVEKTGEVVTTLDRGTIVATPQPAIDPVQNLRQRFAPNNDKQYFVMHEWLKARAEKCLTGRDMAACAGTVYG